MRNKLLTASVLLGFLILGFLLFDFKIREKDSWMKEDAPISQPEEKEPEFKIEKEEPKTKPAPPLANPPRIIPQRSEPDPQIEVQPQQPFHQHRVGPLRRIFR